jgi:hypothetical protein
MLSHACKLVTHRCNLKRFKFCGKVSSLRLKTMASLRKNHSKQFEKDSMGEYANDMMRYLEVLISWDKRLLEFATLLEV